MEMRIARLRLLVAYMLWVMCWSGQKANGQGVGLTLNLINYTNNSVVARTDMGTGHAALLCTTTYSGCCSSANQDTQWYLPDGSQLYNDASLPYYRTKSWSPRAVRLNRNFNGTTTGIFRCDIPDASGVIQSMFVGIYDSGTGQVRLSGGIVFYLNSELNVNTPVFTLTCTSIAGPATTVSWTRGGTTLTDDSNHGIASRVSDGVTATYINTLTVSVRLEGSYTCSVSNSRTSPAAASTLSVAAAGEPRILGAVPAGPTSFTVSWTAPTSGATVTGYRIYWSGGSDQGSMDANAGDTAVTVSGRSHGMVYTISIVALSDQLPSPVVGLTVTFAPSAPTITMANVMSPTSVVLSWTQLPGEVVNNYEIVFSYQGPCSGITHTDNITVVGSSRTHQLSGLQEFSNYTIGVTAVNDGGRATRTQMVTTLSSAPSGAPQMVTATATGTTSISVQWERVDCILRNSDITGYAVSYGQRGDESDSETETVMGTANLMYTVMGLNSSTEYFVMVAAMNSGGDPGPFSNPVFVETPNNLEPTPTPLAVTPGTATPTSVVVSWSQQPSVDSYEISFQRVTGNQQLGECSSGQHSGNVSVGGTVTMYNLTGLQEFSTYLITVTAFSVAGRSRSNPVTVNTQMAAPSSGPEMLRKVETSITIAWDAVNCIERNSIITGYVVRYTPPSTSGTDSVMVAGTGDAGGMVTIDGLAPSTRYSIQVAAVNSDGDVGYLSTALSVQTAPMACTPQGLGSGSLAGVAAGACIGTASLYTVVLLVVMVLCNRRSRERQTQGDGTKGTHFDTDMAMKECVAYGGVAVHSGAEERIYENPK